jgi:glutamate synthase domain-containing protein 2
MLILAGVALGWLVSAAALFVFWFRVLRTIVPGGAKLGKVLESIQILTKLGWRDWFESQRRVETGVSLERPFGSRGQIFDLTNLQFNPTFLSATPLEAAMPVVTRVVLGPLAAKPLELMIPVMLGGMSYGNALSFRAKLGLAKAATQAGTATNSGNGPFLNEERKAATRFVLQLPRGFWSRDISILEQADLIEIGLGHSAWDSAPVRIKGYKLNRELAERFGTIPGLEVLIDSRLPEGRNPQALKQYLAELKRHGGGAPIGIKFGATHHLEQELAIMIECGADILIFDGAEGGTHGAPPLLQDDLGLPLLPGLCRAARFLNERGLRESVSLVVGGGLNTAGDCLKCLALGADAVFIGTIAVLALTHTQVTKAIPWEPPTGLIYHLGKEASRFDPDLAAGHLANFLASWMSEMRSAARTMGKSELRQLSRDDLVALDPLLAEITGVQYLQRIEPIVR